jgi:hypothetical protein
LKTLRATLAVLLLTIVISAGIYLVTKYAGGNSVSLPQMITASSLCPVAGCSAKSCHGAQAVPQLDPGQTMKCPKVGCEAAACHAQDRLISRYNTPKGASLDLWILGLTVFSIAMILVALYV